ncbi:Catalase [Granulicella sibirica]|uniref:Catalase n=2 Tax=Granulicella sibirica TaxID=2479048 RepID=A0A4Q0SXZ3_9BACT|nr:Catalase [Granulicella sibirica]
MTDDPGMKKMLAFNIARDTMPQQQWLAVLEELGPSALPIPNSFPQSKENQDYSYKFFITTTDGIGNQANQPWTSGPTPDGLGQFEPFIAGPLEGAEEPTLGFGRPDTFGQSEQALGTAAGFVSKGKDILDKVKDSF